MRFWLDVLFIYSLIFAKVFKNKLNYLLPFYEARIITRILAISLCELSVEVLIHTVLLATRPARRNCQVQYCLMHVSVSNVAGMVRG